MYICIYVYMYVCMYVYMYICIYVYMYICIYVCMYICIYVYISQTYSTDMMTTDSAATATAYLCGVKTKYEMLGVDDTALRKNCSTVEGAKVQSLLDDALLHGECSVLY